MALLRRPCLGEARLESGGEVDDGGAWGRRSFEHGRASGALLLDDPLDPSPVLVDVLLRLELVAQGVDEALGHLQFLVGDLDVVQLLELLDRGRLDQFVGKHEGGQREVAPVGSDRREVLLLAHYEAADADAAGSGHGVGQQGVRLGVLVR